MNALNDKQKRFCEEYLIDFNATQAAKRAGYSDKTAYSQGHRLLKHVEASKYLKELAEKLTLRTNITAEEVFSKAADILRSSLGTFLDFKGSTVTLKNKEDLSERDISLLKEISETKDGIKIKLHDRYRVLELMFKHFGLLVEDKQPININIYGNKTDKDLIDCARETGVSLPAEIERGITTESKD